MTNTNSENFPAWSNYTNYGRIYGTEGENCSARFERKSVPEESIPANETVFILKTVDKEELISEIKGSSSGSWSGAFTATIIGKSILSFRVKCFVSFALLLTLVLIACLLTLLGIIGFVFAKLLKKPHPKVSQFLTVTSTIFMVVASFCFERVFGRNVNRPAAAIPEEGNNALPIANDVRLAIEQI